MRCSAVSENGQACVGPSRDMRGSKESETQCALPPVRRAIYSYVQF